MKITVKDKEYGLVWGTRCIMLAETKLGIGTEIMLQSISSSNVMLTLVYCAIQTWVEDQDSSNEMPFTFNEFCDWLDCQPSTVSDDFYNSFMTSIFQGKSLKDRYKETGWIVNLRNQPNDDDVKKKLEKVVKDQ